MGAGRGADISQKQQIKLRLTFGTAFERFAGKRMILPRKRRPKWL
jgi:hypothetical protein